jgi:hypothetical protein
MYEPSDICYVERFTQADLIRLRNQLVNSSIDSFQAAQIVSSFLSGRGYGVSQHEARIAASRIDTPRCTVERMQTELERVARVM